MHPWQWKRAAIFLLIVWVLVAYMMLSPMKCPESLQDEDNYKEQLAISKLQLESVKQQYSNLLAHVRKYGLIDIGPMEEYENLRRRIYTNTKELWYYLNNEIKHIMSDDKKIEKLQNLLILAGERQKSLLSDQQLLAEVDGHSEWRKNAALNTSDLVQKRLHHLQNPPDCRAARKLICNLNKGCGFGCQLHHIVYCLIFAYATERTLILHSKDWRYSPKGWDYNFYPLSETCTTAYDDKVVQYQASSSLNPKVMSLPFIDSLLQSAKPEFLPLAIPKDLAHRILQFNGDPASWWVGQMVKYIYKPRPRMQKLINETIAKMNIKRPIVGVHVRRTDKVGTEAALHHIEEYMARVGEYYDQREMHHAVDARRVYLASDDPTVLGDARKKYPSYVFYGDASIAKTAATSRRYTERSLTGLLVDLHMLATSDHVVCTFSSQVCRLAYELMQTNRADASNDYFSLDDIYYFGGQNPHDRVAVMPHRGRDEEMSFDVGDLIGVAGNHWNGYGRGVNKKTNQFGLLPWYKTAEHLVLYPFPEYKEANSHEDSKNL